MTKPEIVLPTREIEDSRGKIRLIENLAFEKLLKIIREIYGDDIPITAFTSPRTTFYIKVQN